jgi:hypothetical protein
MGEITVTITVTNVLVNADDPAVANSEPAFDEGPSTTRSVDENTEAGEDIGDNDPVEAIKATGTEDTSADTFTYGLLRGADTASFDIDSMTGQLKTKAALDYETKDTYMVTVTVTDGKDAEDNFDPAVDDTIRVTITVNDLNEAPVFPDTIAPIEVAEDTVAGVNIGVPVVAMDVDSGDTLTYTLGGINADSFDIDTGSGQLKTKAALDHEDEDTYMVTVTVTDGKDAEDNFDPASKMAKLPTAPLPPTKLTTQSGSLSWSRT